MKEPEALAKPDDLIHKAYMRAHKFDWYRGCYLVALKPREYTAKVTRMCAEYEKTKESCIKFWGWELRAIFTRYPLKINLYNVY